MHSCVLLIKVLQLSREDGLNLHLNLRGAKQPHLWFH